MKLNKEEREAITNSLIKEINRFYHTIRWEAQTFPPAAITELENHMKFLKQLLKKVRKG
jgi:hypothetical protein